MEKEGNKHEIDVDKKSAPVWGGFLSVVILFVIVFFVVVAEINEFGVEIAQVLSS